MLRALPSVAAASTTSLLPLVLSQGRLRFSTSSKGIRHKVVSIEDAVAVVHSGDTIACSGFVAQGAPEALLEGLGKRFEETGEPHSLTAFFGGGPGDWATRGLNHIGKSAAEGPEGTKHNMVTRTIGGHYGQTPKLERLALDNEVEAWSIPLGSISRMVRCQASHVPGHLTTIGLGTFVDPRMTGGKINQKAIDSGFEVVTEMDVDGARHLFYKALPINVAFIRATTGDPDGNLTLEHESLLCDQRVLAMAAKNSGGVVVAQVKRLAALGSQPARSVGVPGALVDCVVVVPPEEHEAKHAMSYFTNHNSAWTSEIREPADLLPRLPLDGRKVIARRAATSLRANQIVNLGIGMPEGISSVAAEENILQHVTMTTEAGAIGGLGASGHDFGPASNPFAFQEINQQFDFYNGGGLNSCFLGMAQTTANGDVNVSRLMKNRLTGPGGFIDITQATRNVTFMGTFTAKGLELAIDANKGSLKIAKEGQIKKFVNETLEVTFSGDEAVRRGQNVYYVTERAVFRRTAKYPNLELIEVAPGVDIERDIVQQMEFEPAIPNDVRFMDERIFKEPAMGLREDLFFKSTPDRCTYHEKDHTIFIDLTGFILATPEEVHEFVGEVEDILKPLFEKQGPIHVVANYDGFDIRMEVEKMYQEEVARLQKTYYASVKRYTGAAFRRIRLGQAMKMEEWDMDKAFKQFDRSGTGSLSAQEIRKGLDKYFGLHLQETQLLNLMAGRESLKREEFKTAVISVLEGRADSKKDKKEE